MTKEHVPDYFRPVIGIREWGIPEKYLRSTAYSGEIWKPGEEKRAVCKTAGNSFWYTTNYIPYVNIQGGIAERPAEPPKPPPNHAPPALGCGCGIYAYYNRKMCVEYGDELASGTTGVRGLISSWGRLILSEYGFKAEYAKLVALILENRTTRLLGSPVSLVAAQRRLADRYGVPLILPAEISSFCEEIGGVMLRPQEMPKSEVYELPNTLPPRFPPPPLSGYYTLGTTVNITALSSVDRQTTYREWREKTKRYRQGKES